MDLFGLSLIVLLTILLALAFDFVNGFHDSANAIATVVATKVLTPLQAVAMAGFFNFLGPFVFTLAVANTIGKGIVETKALTFSALVVVVLGALVGAIVWDLITWWLGLPTSSSHALVGGLIGAGLAVGGVAAIVFPSWPDFLAKELVPMGKYLLIGLAGGAAAALGALLLSRVKLPRALFPILAGVGIAVGTYYAFTHFEPERKVESVANFIIYGGMGAVAGSILWILTQRHATLKDLAPFPVIGACAAFVVGVLTKGLSLSAITKTVLFMVVSPFLGFFVGFLLAVTTTWGMGGMHPGSVNTVSRRAQLFSSAFYALTHGTNDAQKTMGVIAVLLFGASMAAWEAGGAVGPAPEFIVPYWVIVLSAAAMGLGTLMGGWRIVETMASRITHLRPIQGFAAETGGGLVLTAMAQGGIPVSTTHAISASIMGVGATRRLSAVRWGVGRRIVAAWILTIPASAAIAYLCAFAVGAVTGDATQPSTTAWVLFGVLVALLGVYAMYKRRPRVADPGAPLLETPQA